MILGTPPRGGQVTGEQLAFGSELRQERERRKITLASVAESIKIKQSLLASLERGDASRWPPGIYRRAFLREYAAALGLPSESIVAEFVRLFPESGAAPNGIHPPDDGSDLRLTLGPERRLLGQSFVLQAIAALLDGFVVLTSSAAIGTLIQAGIWTIIGVLAVIYYSISTGCLGSSPALWLMNATVSYRANLSKPRIRIRPSSRELLHIVSTPSRPEAWSPPYEAAAPQFVEKARSAS